MAGNIQNVNLPKLKGEIDDYKSVAIKLQASMTNIRKYMESFTTCWTGERINAVITLWNKSCSTMDNQVCYFGMKIRLILNEIYNQYSAMEKGAPKDSSYGYAWGGINKIKLTDSSKIKFEKAKAESIAKNIQIETNNVVNYLKQLITKLDSMQTYSDSLKTLSITYKETATGMQKSLIELCTNIQQEVNRAISDVKATESFNENDAKRANNQY